VLAIVRTVRSAVGRILHRRTAWGSRRALRGAFGVSDPRGRPTPTSPCGVLRSEGDVRAAVAEVQRLGLPPHFEPAKNWDSLAALDLILRSTTRRALVVDAGGELFSRIVPWLGLYGYTRLVVSNLRFDDPYPPSRGAIVYREFDLTRMPFKDASVDVVTCLSVIEHGIGIDAYFREMARVLKPGGLLITSTDYWDSPVDTRGQVVRGVPIKVFTSADVDAMLAVAVRYGFSLVAPLDLTVGERVVYWEHFDLRYTFMLFSLRKRSRP